MRLVKVLYLNSALVQQAVIKACTTDRGQMHRKNYETIIVVYINIVGNQSNLYKKRDSESMFV